MHHYLVDWYALPEEIKEELGRCEVEMGRLEAIVSELREENEYLGKAARVDAAEIRGLIERIDELELLDKFGHCCT